MPDYKTIHPHFKLNGSAFTTTTLKEKAHFFIEEGAVFEKEIGEFLLQWLEDSPVLHAKTSGSTGAPKAIEIQKQAMVNSALATGLYFNLKPKSTALLCLPATYIAGKMMLVRAMVLGLEIDGVSPQSDVDFNRDTVYDFVAMVPMQLLKTKDRLQNIKQLIVGGAPVSNALLDKIQPLKTTIYETYGMTETVSHIAVKQLNNLSTTTEVSTVNTALLSFEILPNIIIYQDDRECLVIEAPLLLDSKIVTNDIVELQSTTTFKWLGRFDNVINSGGVKMHPEQIEAALKRQIHSRFFIASEADDRLGEALILVIEGDEMIITPSVFAVLENYKKPKAIYFIDAFAETTSGKIQRQKTLALLKKA
ncbi:AMP-binding protein [Bizionia gelidisalsuginis]|uniref:AMP-binding protein n=1 Tax=Bizionia gelidisalsuginis TaxID=291188 RepID=A0ABY3MC18_9FLAO|nr:AMP-binding protein [Bizionia gelidisalsuginis]TYC14855.1 AMP-binding protein [Bizionia gelidisalsuginis]